MSNDEPANAPERVWLAPDLGDDWSILKVGDAIYWEGIDRHHPDDCETEYVRADIAAVRIRELEARLKTSTKQRDFWKSVFSRHFTSVKNGTHVIVPVVPTEEMADAGGEQLLKHPGKWPETAAAIYRAMIRAAQPERQ